VWDLQAGRTVKVVHGSEFDTQILDGQWSPDGMRIIFADEKGRFCFFGTGSGETLQRAKYEQFFAVEFRPEGEINRDEIRRVALAADPTVPSHVACAGDFVG